MESSFGKHGAIIPKQKPPFIMINEDPMEIVSLPVKGRGHFHKG